jgi:hypothetical protein
VSGGSYDYLYSKVDDFADSMRPGGAGKHVDPALRELFRPLVRKVAAAMRAIEWNDSGDGDCDEQKLIRECLGMPVDDYIRNELLRTITAVEGTIRTAKAVLEKP